ncbi:helix-turn-helix domain-containing protein [Gelidibacter salicanalis]|uniref:Helix-turn-helix transcriptional regulator n=1 Tax=Gelidibacter salicanalis TaxID=291193 RepID=A0A934KW72_9FLAO|nr:AraC family transcriptional regulator [Gelidibacter salicanalis]MBJ7880495.1 helix-turn-helix transcriptional regulator [Gelidibacter salicanalis]
MNDLYSFEIREGHTKNERYFKGFIEKRKLTDKLEYLGFQLKCISDYTINLKTEKESSVYLCVNLADRSALSMTCGESLISIPSFSSVLVPFENAETLAFNCKSNKDYDFLVLKIEKSDLDQEQTELIRALQAQNKLLDPSNNPKILLPNLGMCEMSRLLKRSDKTSCANKFIVRGYSNILFGLKLEELLLEEKSSAKTTYLRNFEIQQLEVLTDKIKANPQQQYTIKELCTQTGLSVSKLQTGFKEMHNCTVAIFIRNIRLEKALDMLRNTDLNVSEIVYSVGLTSRSYFCRIFKKRFKCSPKSFQQQLRTTSTLAS